ncbi:hypothetical protein N7539_008615 [Penicillium diatomitis]|uniref:HMG box domain-containing protein n=1 Tax=Penicillium diatomitis TaxID=2819901 RepID=A0A9X0BLV9_9EURO|nr:uncharacterized protein N7539_008583 [Penicillium diatomitis]XP_056786592.1 uncharacterized protein N7539_008615 [Penicillium diatomitis]KAJ5472014.1 hypothetical protein N7539_008583 [Penicillium diatomitis]KAJ5472046.1 hypothetical protein N7539_008615 [Penicillium diatomitis]
MRAVKPQQSLIFDLPTLRSQILERYRSQAYEKAAARVDKPPSIRQTEALNRGGKINRPLNAFILFRFAYYCSIVEYLASRYDVYNNTVVSQVAGGLWRMDPITQYTYKSLAEIERRNHSEAYPDYKLHHKPNSSKSSEQAVVAKYQVSFSGNINTEILEPSLNEAYEFDSPPSPSTGTETSCSFWTNVHDSTFDLDYISNFMEIAGSYPSPYFIEN